MLLFGKDNGKSKMILKGKRVEENGKKYIDSKIKTNGDGVVMLHILVTAMFDIIEEPDAKEMDITIKSIKKLIDEMYKNRKKEENNENNL